MHIEYPIDFIRKDGAIFRAETPEEASEHRQYIGEKHRAASEVYDWRSDDGSYVVHVDENEWIARDALGQTVTSGDIPPAPRRRSSYARWYRRQDDARLAAERGLPIPGIGVHHTRYRKRVPQMMAERRSNMECAAALRAGLAIGYRIRDAVPRCWDDGNRREPQRCWKEQRATRWKR